MTSRSIASRERKRISDRHAQRVSRARTKTRIEQLEQQVEQWKSLSCDGDNAALREAVAKQQASHHDLLKTLSKVHNLAERLVEETKVIPTGNARQSVAVSPTSNDDEFVATQAGSILSNRVEEWNTDERISIDLGTLMDHSPSSKPGSDQMSVNLEPRIDQINDGNYFEHLNRLTVWAEEQGKKFGRLDDTMDDDINIRAVIHGWPDVHTRHVLDVGWQVAEKVDLSLMRDTGPAERIAVLKVFRSMFLVSRLSFVSLRCSSVIYS
jgi:hypothetical protein